MQGNVSYEVHRRGSPLLQTVSNFVYNDSSRGAWMLVAFWQDVPEVFLEEQVNFVCYIRMYV